MEIFKSLVIISFIISLNIFISDFDYRFDFTDQKIFSLSSKTKEFLHSIDQPVSISFAYDIRNRAFKDAAETLRLFSRETEHISLEIFDPVIEPSLAEKHGIRFAGTAIIESGERKVEVNLVDEISFVNSLIKAVSSEIGLVCFTTGHLESDPFSLQSHDHFEGGSHNHSFGGKPITVHEKHGMGGVFNKLVTLGYKVKTVFLGKDSKQVDDCLVIVIASPQRAFLKSEVVAIRDYINRGGNLLLMVEPNVKTGLELLFQDFGVSWNSDFIFDNHSHLRADKFSVAVTQYPKHRITRDIALTVYPGVVAFEVIHLEKPNQLRPSITPLVETSERAASASERTDFGKKIIGLNITSKINDSNIILFGDGDFATNSFYNIGDNGRFFLKIIEDLTKVENPLGIEPKGYKEEILDLTNNQVTILFMFTTLALPTFFLLLGLYVFLKSRV